MNTLIIAENIKLDGNVEKELTELVWSGICDGLQREASEELEICYNYGSDPLDRFISGRAVCGEEVFVYLCDKDTKDFIIGFAKRGGNG